MWRWRRLHRGLRVNPHRPRSCNTRGCTGIKGDARGYTATKEATRGLHGRVSWHVEQRGNGGGSVEKMAFHRRHGCDTRGRKGLGLGLTRDCDCNRREWIKGDERASRRKRIKRNELGGRPEGKVSS